MLGCYVVHVSEITVKLVSLQTPPSGVYDDGVNNTIGKPENSEKKQTKKNSNIK